MEWGVSNSNVMYGRSRGSVAVGVLRIERGFVGDEELGCFAPG